MNKKSSNLKKYQKDFLKYLKTLKSDKTINNSWNFLYNFRTNKTSNSD